MLGLAGGAGGSLPRPGEMRGVDPAEAYDRFHAKWEPRLGLKDHHVAESFKRGHDPD